MNFIVGTLLFYLEEEVLAISNEFTQAAIMYYLGSVLGFGADDEGAL